MAQVPYQGAPEQAPVALPHGEFHLTVSPEAFGGGLAKGLQGLGAGLTQGADTWEEMRVDAAVNDSIKQAEAITEEYDKLPADQRVSREQEYRDRVDSVFNQHKGQFPGWYAQHFDNQVRPYQFRYINGKISTGAITAGHQVTKETNDATLGRATDLARRDPTNEANLGAALDIAKNAKVKQVQDLYGNDPVMIEQAKRDATADVYEAAAVALVGKAEHDPVAALQLKRMVDEHSAELGNRYPALQNKADEAMGTWRGRVTTQIQGESDPTRRQSLIDANREILGNDVADALGAQGRAPAVPSDRPKSIEENFTARRLLELENAPKNATPIPAQPAQSPNLPAGTPGPRTENYTPTFTEMAKAIESHTSAELNLAQLPGNVIGQAREVALRRGPAGVAQFMADNGYPKSGAWCGEFAAAVLRSAGGTPPKNPEVASNWRTYGLPVNEPSEGFLAIRKGSLRGYPVGTGQTGSHVTFVDSVDKASGTFVGIGGNQPTNKERFRISDYDFRSS